jgi:dUTP pyrophosphatase
LVKKGDRIAQLVIYRLFKPIMKWADEVDETARGDQGFGSTGK